ncbi:hypothetical protein [Massilia scottii]|uniref:hypothetical protein n=1 Tax=Massilia scottii TaxID=3057166 RepID=UPI0027967C21|nr:hypothetical protein [Massilia sp. CCM 9029]MDQ1833300.1 hypothetical protein [Massilia sp. CCM 9029]
MHRRAHVHHRPHGRRLYFGYFGRAADAGGLARFEQQLGRLGAPRTVAGLSAAYDSNPALRGLIDSFGASAGSQALHGGDSAVFVKAVFNNVLNRAPCRPAPTTGPKRSIRAPAGKAGLYNGAAAAGLVKNLSMPADAGTDVAAFQVKVDAALAALAGLHEAPAAWF